MEKEQSNARGKVKYYREDKGFGFIVDGNGSDHFVHISDAEGETSLRQGDQVVFDGYHTDRGMRAYSVRVKERGAAPDRPLGRSNERSGTKARDNTRVECRNCGKWMIPRIITGPAKFAKQAPHRWTPVPLYSMCPLCGTTHETFNQFTGDSASGLIYGAFVLIAVLIVGSVILGGGF
ncbi:cold-shock protein [Vreelandella utahensis]|uniref:cold-shock protein n=1 Tax=Vreelandella halophila TaxID=86177 RepID=UPI000987098C|nr:cold shock domain-containing protein [Halomonas utahensis]